MSGASGSTEPAERRSLDRIASSVAELLDAPLVLISVLERARPEIVGAHGLVPQGVQGQDRCELCRDVALSGRPVIVQDARRRLPPPLRHGWGLDLVAYAGVPLSIAGGMRVGTLAAFSTVRRTWQSRDLAVLRAFADVASEALDAHARCEALRVELEGERETSKQQVATNSAAYANLASRAADVAVATAERERVASYDHRRITAELETTSLHDELTGLLNRRGLFMYGNAQLDSLRRDGRRGLMLYLDIDGLKATNDRCGHAAGDDELRAAAGVLRATFREADTIARLGGDEFVVLATDTANSARSTLLARLSAELARCNERRDPATPLVWSLGFVSIDPDAPKSLDALMSEADRRMYAVKRGRQVEVVTSADVPRW